MTMIKGPENAGPPPKALMQAIDKLGEEGTRNGTLIETGGLLPSAMGARVRLAKGKITVLDGPFSEAKELIGGYAVFELKSKEEAVEAARRFMEVHKEHWPGWEGETEVRQIFNAADFAHPR
ncbi:MAG: YciI family protein [Gemmatimonadaceae bacterium]